MFGRNKVAMLAAEFLGSLVLAMVVLAVIRSALSLPYFVAIAVGTAFAGMVMVFGSISGAHFNPVITAGLWTIRQIQAPKAIAYIAAQFLGAITALSLYEYLIDEKLQSVTRAFAWNVFTAEAAGAFVLALGVAATLYKVQDVSRPALTTGVVYFLGILIASTVSNGLINPAVAVAVRSWDWAYAAGPLVGAVLGMNVYRYVFTTEAFPRLPKRNKVSSKIATKKSKSSLKKTKK